MIKQIGIVAFLIIAGVLSYGMLYQQSNAIVDESQAVRFVLADVKDFQGDVRVLFSSQSGSKWAVSILMTSNPHSACPTMEKRDYALLPVSFRPEKIISSCEKRVPIVYREEALIDSAKLLSFSGQAYGCAFKNSEFNAQAALEYCPRLDFAAYNSFSQELPQDAWGVFWTDGLAQKFVALDSAAQVLKRS